MLRKSLGDMGIDLEQIRYYRSNGFVVAESLFTKEEIESFKDHFEEIRQRETMAENPDGGDSSYLEDDPLLRYPRIMQPHRRYKKSLDWLIDPRLNQVMTALLGNEPLAVQTMFYFKPPGARGQALHQDQYFLRVQPGTCIAAWLAIDDCDETNGCLQVVPASHDWPLLCTQKADARLSFTELTVDLPKEVETIPIALQAGDVVFFNGQLVHGSLPNTTTNRFRRALIGHYLVGDAEKVVEYYHPVLNMQGETVEMGINKGGGTCGMWVDREGQCVLEMQTEIVNKKIFGS